MSRMIPYVVAGAVAAGALFSTGCLGAVRVGAHAHVAEPELVYVSPGVYVVEDHHEAVFYSDDYYWVNRGGYWYRSSYYSDGWVRVSVVPRHVRSIHRPHRYRRYRARAGVKRTRVPARRSPAVRDHRDHRRSRPAPASRSRTRDHRRPARHQPSRSRPAVRKQDHRSRKAPPKVHTKDHRRSAPPPKKKKSKVKKKDHRRDR